MSKSEPTLFDPVPVTCFGCHKPGKAVCDRCARRMLKDLGIKDESIDWKHKWPCTPGKQGSLFDD